MKISGAILRAALLWFGVIAGAQATDEAQSPNAAEQQEADYRVIAARCGTPSFERAFYKQSAAAVSAGLVSRNRRAAEVEKSITLLRRSPFVLVAGTSDCRAELQKLTALLKSRSVLLKGTRASGANASLSNGDVASTSG